MLIGPGCPFKFWPLTLALCYRDEVIKNGKSCKILCQLDKAVLTDKMKLISDG